MHLMITNRMEQTGVSIFMNVEMEVIRVLLIWEHICTVILSLTSQWMMN